MNNILFTLISITASLASLWLFKKNRASKITVTLFFILMLASIILFSLYSVAVYFTGNGIDEATIYHLKYGLEGAGFLEYSALMIVIFCLFLFAVFRLSKFISTKITQTKTSTWYGFFSLSLLMISLLLNPVWFDLYQLKKENLIFTSTVNPEVPDDFYQYYKTPQIKRTEQEKQKNILFIYAESLERTYLDESLFPNLMNGIRSLKPQSTYFTNIKQVAGAGWTVAGMTTSQCGIPLFTPSHGNSMSGMDQFLPSAVCLGDLLKEVDYQLHYMGGADLNFAGKGKLLKTHGFDHVFGRDELTEKLKDKNYKSGWGLYDDSLFDMVYEEFITLSKSNKPFGLFTLTLDTHHPNGHPSASCEDQQYQDGSNPILNAVACSDYLISNFINKIIESEYAENTIIVLASDHLTFRNTAFDLIQKGNRSTLLMFIDPSQNKNTEITTLGSTLDIGTTLLPFIGYEGQIGFGRNLLDQYSTEEERSFIHKNLSRWAFPITRFWNFPKIENQIAINLQQQTFNIDDRSFKFPAFIELNEQLQSTLKFYFDGDSGHQSLIDHRNALNANDYFLLIDECKNLSKLDRSLGRQGFCFMAGQGKQYTKIQRLEENLIFTVDELRQLLM